MEGLRILKEYTGKAPWETTRVDFLLNGEKFNLVTIHTSAISNNRYYRSLYDSKYNLICESVVNKLNSNGHEYKGFDWNNPVYRELYRRGYLSDSDFAEEE